MKKKARDDTRGIALFTRDDSAGNGIIKVCTKEKYY